MSIILTILFICLAAIFKAIADTLRDHFDTSIFKWKNPKRWNPVISWQYVGYIRFTKYHPDAWHIANSLMIAFFDAALVSISTLAFHWKWYWFALEYVIIGMVFLLSFNLFYDKILKR